MSDCSDIHIVEEIERTVLKTNVVRDNLQSREQTNQILLRELRDSQLEQARHNERVSTALEFLANSMEWMTEHCVTQHHELQATSAADRNKIIQAGQNKVSLSSDVGARYPLRPITEDDEPQTRPLSVQWDNTLHQPTASFHRKFLCDSYYFHKF